MGEISRLYAKTPDVQKSNSVLRIQRKKSSQSMKTPADRILFLQRTIGNQAVQRLIKSGALQAKLRIGQPGDMYEQEADRVADAVMRMPEPGVQRQVEPEEEEEEEILQAKPLAKEIFPLVQRQVELEEEEEEELQAKATSGHLSEVTTNLESNILSLKGGGQPLPESDRAYFEPRFGRDFSHVRVHTDTQAAESAQAVNAHAFTFGNDIFFGVGKWNPGSAPSCRLIAHELAHTVQQRPNAPKIQRLAIDIHPLDPGSFTTKSAKAFDEIPSPGVRDRHRRKRNPGFMEDARKWSSKCSLLSGWKIDFRVKARFQIYLDKLAFRQQKTHLRGLNTLKGALGHEQRHVINYLNFYARLLISLFAIENKRFSDSKSCSHAANNALKGMDRAYKRFQTAEMEHKNGNPANNTGYHPIAPNSPYDFLKIVTKS